MQLHQAAAQVRWFENVPFTPDHDFGGGDDFLANRINRWIGDLCEQLLEIVV